MRPQRYDFASDNSAGVHPLAAAAMAAANTGAVAAYGDDQLTQQLRARVSEVFETDCSVYLLLTGTAANALALAQLCQPFHSIVCHQYAHIETDECGACEFFTRGSKLILTASVNGKVDLEEVARALVRQHELHSHKPRVISVTQATEFGAIYTPDEISTIADFARKRAMFLHMDGARFANAMAALGCAPKEVSWKAGVDVLCFGGTKNGLAAGELVIFFNQEQARDFEYRMKQAGQLSSKMRFFAAAWLSLLEDQQWLRIARHANASAALLGEKLRKVGAEIILPVETNAIFIRLSYATLERLRDRGWEFYKFVEPDVYRLMCAWSTTDEIMDELVHDFEVASSCMNSIR